MNAGFKTIESQITDMQKLICSLSAIKFPKNESSNFSLPFETSLKKNYYYIDDDEEFLHSVRNKHKTIASLNIFVILFNCEKSILSLIY